MRVLIVDDEIEICQRLQRELQKEGCKVEYTTSAIGVLERLKNAEKEGKGYALLLLDLRMPKVDGLSLLKEIREARLDLDVVIITGYGDEDKAIESIRLGAVDYLPKPISPEALHTAVFRVRQKRAAEKKRALEYSVLVVDDEKELCARIKRELDKEGYRTAVAYDGQEGLDYFSHNRVDVAIVDIRMPRMDGLEMLEKCREISDDFVSIIITGHGDHERAIRALQLGVFSYLRKPISLEELVIAVGKGIEFLHLRRSLAASRRELEIETALREQYAQNQERMVEERTRELRESEKRYHAIIEDQTELICRFLPDGTLTFVNRAYCRYFDKKPDELIGRSFMPLIPQEDREKVEQRFTSLSPENPVVTYEHRVILPDGEIRWQQWTDRAIFDEQGRLIEFQSVGRDITDRVRAEQEISQRAARLSAINRISAAVSTLDLNEILNTITQQMVELFAVEHSGVLMFDEKKEWGYVLAEHPDWGATAERFQVKGYLAAERIIADREPLVIEDTWQDPLMASVRETMHRLDIRSMLIVPLIVRGEVIGSIGLDAVGRQRRFAAEEVALAQTIANQVSIAIENARLFEAEQRRRQEAETLREISRAVCSTLELDEVLSLVLRQAKRVLAYDTASILLFSDGQPSMVAVAGYEDEELVKTEVPVRLGDSPILQAMARDHSPVIIADVREDKRWIWIPGAEHVRAWIGVPLLVRGEMIGALMIDSRQPGSYTEADAAIAQALANQVAVVIENARLFTSLTQEKERLELLYRLSRHISESLDVRQVAQRALDGMCAVVGALRGIALVREPDSDRLRLVAVSGYDAESVEALDQRLRLRLGKGLAGWVAAQRQPALVDDVTKDEHWMPVSGLDDWVRSALSVPLLSGDELVGVLSIYSDREAFFNDEHRRLAESAAATVAVAIANALLYEATKQALWGTITAMVKALEAKDPYARGHSERVAEYAVAIAKELGLPSEKVEEVRLAAKLHDVGKIGIDEQILAKRDGLNEEEWEAIRSHPRWGAEIIRPISSLNQLVPIILHHHERYNGRGYPNGLRGEDIPLEARIIAVADAFEAMTSDRPYRPALSYQEAIAELKANRGTQFDPQVVDAFLAVLEKGLVPRSRAAIKEGSRPHLPDKF